MMNINNNNIKYYHKNSSLINNSSLSSSSTIKNQVNLCTGISRQVASNLVTTNAASGGFKFSAKNYKNLDPIKKQQSNVNTISSIIKKATNQPIIKSDIDKNVNLFSSSKSLKPSKLLSNARLKKSSILPINLFLNKNKKSEQQYENENNQSTKMKTDTTTTTSVQDQISGSLVGSKLLSSVKDLRKSLKSLIDQTSTNSTSDSNKNKQNNNNNNKIKIPIDQSTDRLNKRKEDEYSYTINNSKNNNLRKSKTSITTTTRNRTQSRTNSNTISTSINHNCNNNNNRTKQTITKTSSSSSSKSLNTNLIKNGCYTDNTNYTNNNNLVNGTNNTNINATNSISTTTTENISKGTNIKKTEIKSSIEQSSFNRNSNHFFNNNNNNNNNDNKLYYSRSISDCRLNSSIESDYEHGTKNDAFKSSIENLKDSNCALLSSSSNSSSSSSLTCSSISIELTKSQQNLIMGIKHASKFGDSSSSSSSSNSKSPYLTNSTSLYDYSLLDTNNLFTDIKNSNLNNTNNKHKNFSLLKYSISFPVNFDIDHHTSTPNQTLQNMDKHSNNRNSSMTLSSVKSKDVGHILILQSEEEEKDEQKLSINKKSLKDLHSSTLNIDNNNNNTKSTNSNVKSCASTTTHTTSVTNNNSSNNSNNCNNNKRLSFKEKLIKINKRWSLSSKFNENEATILNNNNNHNNTKLYEINIAIDNYNTNSSLINRSNSGKIFSVKELNFVSDSNEELSIETNSYSTTTTSSATASTRNNRFSLQSDIVYTDNFNNNHNLNQASVSGSFKSSPRTSNSSNRSSKKARSTSLNSSNRSSLKQSLNNLILSRAIVIKEFTPSPYDKNSLCLKIGDIIDVIDMSETGIWTGILNKKLGKFKFIYVRIIETFEQLLNSTSSSHHHHHHHNQTKQSSTESINRAQSSSNVYKLEKLLTNRNRKINKSKSYGYLVLIKQQEEKNFNQLKLNNNNNNLIAAIKVKSKSTPDIHENLTNSVLINFYTYSFLNSDQLEEEQELNNNCAHTGNNNNISNSSYIYSSESININKSNLIKAYNNREEEQEEEEIKEKEQDDVKEQQQQEESSYLEQKFDKKNNNFLTETDDQSNTKKQNECKLNKITNNNNTNLEKVKLRKKMGQKPSKSSHNLLLTNLDENLILTNNKKPLGSTSSSTSSTSSKTKSNHDSHISNDSGCYSADRYSSPSGSSVLCLFDLANQNLEQTIKLKNNPKSKNLLKSTCKTLTRQQQDIISTDQINKTQTLKTTSNKRNNNNNKQIINRSSVCDSIILSCSSSSSSLNVENEPIDEEDESNKKAQLLCDQLNQILNISTNIVSQQQIQLENSVKRNRDSNSSSKYKTKTIINRPNFITSSSSSSSSSSASSSSSTKIVNRSFTFHSNNQNFINDSDNQCNKNVIKNFLSSTEENANNLVEPMIRSVTSSNQKNFKNSSSTKKLSNFVIKNGRRLLDAWTNQNNCNQNFTSISTNHHNNHHHKSNSKIQENNNDNNAKTSNSKQNAKKSLKSEEKLINLIAAKLLSENIELAKAPYTDEYGFCKIPIALVKRYSSELNYDIETVSKCIEAERLGQLEKLGKLAIPNDFLYKMCKCKTNLIETSDMKWKLCKCNLDMSNIDAFFTCLGLPMYIDTICTKFNLNQMDNLSKLIEINEKQFEFTSGISNKTHLKIIISALQSTKP